MIKSDIYLKTCVNFTKQWAAYYAYLKKKKNGMFVMFLYTVNKICKFYINKDQLFVQ